MLIYKSTVMTIVFVAVIIRIIMNNTKYININK